MKWIEPQKYMKKFQLREFPQPDLIQLNYPVLMCHGYGGISMLIKPSPIHDSCMRLRSYGVEAFAPNIVPYSTIGVRAEQWAERIVQLQQKYGYEKLNVVAHSMGGLDIRAAISSLGMDSDVASLTTISTPHQGTSLADIVLTAPELLKDKLNELMNWLGENILPGSKSDAAAAVEQLTPDYVQNEFNPNTPDKEGVAYFSVTRITLSIRFIAFRTSLSISGKVKMMLLLRQKAGSGVSTWVRSLSVIWSRSISR